MIVDCDRCVVRGEACGECVITVLLGAPPGRLELDGTDRRALDTLAAAGMVPRLQLVERDRNHTLPESEADGARSGSAALGGQSAERVAVVVQRSDRHVS